MMQVNTDYSALPSNLADLFSYLMMTHIDGNHFQIFNQYVERTGLYHKPRAVQMEEFKKYFSSRIPDDLIGPTDKELWRDSMNEEDCLNFFIGTICSTIDKYGIQL